MRLVSADLLQSARAALQARNEPLRSDVTGAYTEAWAKLDIGSHYNSFPDTISSAWPALSTAGEQEFARIHAKIMVAAIDRFEERAIGQHYPASVRENFRLSYTRILSAIAARDIGPYGKPSDLLWKEMALATQRLMPGGARVLEPRAFLPRSILFRGGPLQTGRAARLLIRSGTGPYLTMHVHDPEIEKFSEQGWYDLMLLIADVLALRPDLKGVFGGGWLYDPQLPTVSPRLAYHRTLTIPNGAMTFFYAKDGENSYAFSKSATRRRLHSEGQYDPELHMWVWERTPLIEWAQKQAGGVGRTNFI
jgi:hypothetical protein|tara:strand:- start:107282 stop:108202 length:921 start_codon:yes stop_codon:yes gene_type:complete